LEAAALLARNAWRAEPVQGPVHLTVVFEAKRILVMVRPSDAERGKIKGDLDNLTKSLADCLVRGGVLGDDSQVVELSVRMNG
jgi:Holliday junction resolvase RusA-like endonuclease